MNGYYNRNCVTGEEITPARKNRRNDLQGARLPGQTAFDRRSFDERQKSMPQRMSLATGCKVYPDCLTCPLPKCIYDEALSTQIFKAKLGMVFELQDRGHSIRAIAKLTDYSSYSIRDILQNKRRNLDKEYTENEFLLGLKSE